MWYHAFKSVIARSPASTPRRLDVGQTAGILSRFSAGGLFALTLPILSLAAPPAIAQTELAQTESAPPEPPAPTVRYARGEDVDLADIVSEWRGYYADIPVYQCVCQQGLCSQTEAWPYREFDRYQLSLALGPTNAQATEAAGFNCFDIADGSRPSNPREFSAALRESGQPEATAAAPPPVPPAAAEATADEPAASDATVNAPVAQPSPALSARPISPGSASIPSATVINNGAAVRLDWPSGRSDTVSVASNQWNINILNALDCDSLSVVAQKTMTAQRVQGNLSVDAVTGHVAVPVLLDSCVEVDQMAVFVLDPTEGGGYSLYRTQLPPVRGVLASQAFSFPDEFSSYAYNTIVGLRHLNGSLLVGQGSASGAEVVSVFQTGPTPAGTYAGCVIVRDEEGAGALCE